MIHHKRSDSFTKRFYNKENKPEISNRLFIRLLFSLAFPALVYLDKFGEELEITNTAEFEFEIGIGSIRLLVYGTSISIGYV